MPTWQELIDKEGRLSEWPYPIRYEKEQEIETDVLVLGGGIAGCWAIISAARENDYVLAGRAMGATNLRLILRHLLPNCFPPLIVLMTMQMGIMILAEAGLSFLGIGVEPPVAAWGAMVTDGYRYLLTNPMLSFAPGLAVMLVVFAYNMVGDGLRDAIDPRLRGTL